MSDGFGPREYIMADHEGFEVLPAGEMRIKYGLTAENRPLIRLNSDNIPPALQQLIPLAEKFGISDDLIREDFLAKTPKAEVEEMQRCVAAQNDVFDAWLAGPEADGSTFSAEYIAFTCLRMAADGC